MDLFYDNEMQHRPQELEVRSIASKPKAHNVIMCLQTKSSQCHYVPPNQKLTMSLHNDIVSFWFGGNGMDIRTELQVPVHKP